MNITRRKFLGFASLIPAIGKIVKDIARDDEPVIELELEGELEAWDKLSDKTMVWSVWTPDLDMFGASDGATSKMTVSTSDDWVVMSDSRTYATASDSDSGG